MADSLKRKPIHANNTGNIQDKEKNMLQQKSKIIQDHPKSKTKGSKTKLPEDSSLQENEPVNQEIGGDYNRDERLRSVSPGGKKGKSPKENQTILNEASCQTIDDPPKQWKNILLFLLIAIVIGFVFVKTDYSALYGYATKPRLVCNFNRLIKRYPSEDKSLWVALKYGIEDILNLENPEGPSVYLFMRDNSSTAVNTNFVEDIAYLTASCFDKELEPITFTKDDFDSDDYGIAIAKYKKDIHDGGVLVVTVNLNEVPGAAARALHTICDKFSPIVRKVVIFLSLIIDPKSEGLPLQIAEDTLRTLWRSSLTRNELDPLIVRVSDSVFRLKS
ncbi:uncharacterized protein LOC129606903 [Condylostylus longicornis]|uniref:uncharacterized protein LOC129606903 n=1 Tax=Condylostylus longicornis TaxID=2530218 RepID=UPI00244DE23D|nr:uncharacterized protein LOC129606903 [Condylostylus longicornis]